MQEHSGRSSSFGRGQNTQESLGFTQGIFNMNQHHQSAAGYADRRGRGNLAPLNSAAFGQGQQQTLGEPTPGTGYDMNFTPLLPAGLLLGSPFQPGSPGFTSPQFASFGQFQQVNNQQNYQNQQSAMSPSLYQGMQSPTFDSQYLTGPQSPTFNMNQGMGGMGQMAAGIGPGMSRTVYLGNIPPDTSAEEILSHVRSGQIESVRLLPDKNCAFISFLESSSATHFHSDGILKKLAIKGQDIKIGWGKPSHVPTSVAVAVQQSAASRNVYLGNLPEDISEEELREDLGKFGPIDTIKMVKEKNISFVHFLSIGNAIKAVAQLPQEARWQAPRRVFYGKDRCAYVSKTQQQNAAQYLGIAPGYAHMLNDADRDLISNALAQQSVAAAAVATTAGGATNLGNRTVYLGNIHPETTIEEICNVVRGGLLHHVRYIPEKHICFVTFIDPTAAASFYALSNLQGLMIHNRRLKIGWGKHSGAIPGAIALAVSGGASRNVYIGNLDESWTEERLRQDFSEYGEIELVNALREKSCAFVNFTNIANAIKAIEGMRGKEEYKRFKINFGKDRCGNAPRQNHHGAQQQQQPQPPMFAGGRDSISQSPLHAQANGMDSPARIALSPPPESTTSTSQNGASTTLGPTPSAILNAGNNNPLTMYLTQVQQGPADDMRGMVDQFAVANLHQQQQSALAAQQTALYGGSSGDLLNGSVVDTPTSAYAQSSGAFSGAPTGSAGIGLLVPTARSQHNRAISLPAFGQDGYPEPPSMSGVSLLPPSHKQQQSSFSAISSGLGGFGNAGFGLAIGSTEGIPTKHLTHWHHHEGH